MGSARIVDVFKEIETERNRLIKLVASKEFAENQHWEWMPEWLTKTNEEHLQDPFNINYDAKCDICRTPSRFLAEIAQEKWCPECGGKQRICKACLSKLLNEFE